MIVFLSAANEHNASISVIGVNVAVGLFGEVRKTIDTPAVSFSKTRLIPSMSTAKSRSGMRGTSTTDDWYCFAKKAYIPNVGVEITQRVAPVTRSITSSTS